MTTSKATLLFLIAFTSVPLASCKKDPPRQMAGSLPAPSAVAPVAPEITIPQVSSAKRAPEPLKVAITWNDPPAWKRLPQRSAMRAATYEIPRASGDQESGEMAVFYFGPGQGGDVDGNVERWAKQFGKSLATVKRTNREVNGLKQHVVEIDKGDYSSDMMGQGGKQMKDWAMLAAIVHAPSGSYFFKLTGPDKSVAAEEAAFFALLDSIKTRD